MEWFQFFKHIFYLSLSIYNVVHMCAYHSLTFLEKSYYLFGLLQNRTRACWYVADVNADNNAVNVWLCTLTFTTLCQYQSLSIG